MNGKVGKELLFNIQLDDQDYQAMLLSYLLKLSSYELARKKLNVEVSTKEKLEQEDVDRLEEAEAKISEIIMMIDSVIFTPCLIHYLKTYHPDKLGLITNDKGKIITMINKEAKEAIEKEVEKFERLGKGNMKNKYN